MKEQKSDLVVKKSKSLFKKEQLSKERSLLGVKREKQWKTVKIIQKIRFFSSKSLVFESNSLKALANHSCRSFLIDLIWEINEFIQFE